jgi:hypothetical protein
VAAKLWLGKVWLGTKQALIDFAGNLRVNLFDVFKSLHLDLNGLLFGYVLARDAIWLENRNHEFI